MGFSRRQFVATTLAGAAGLGALGEFGSAARLFAQGPPDEDGYRLWLRYAAAGASAVRHYRAAIRQVVVEGPSPTADVIRRELALALPTLVGEPVPVVQSGLQAGAVVIGTPSTSAAIRALAAAGPWQAAITAAGDSGYVIRPGRVSGRDVLAIASSGELGALYGTFHLLRLMQTGRAVSRLDIVQKPKLDLRLLNHWDNPNGTIERGYAGRSLWQWDQLPGQLDERYRDYARANASIGINGAVINNVNADIRMLTPEYLGKAAALAAVWRPYGIRLYLSPNFAAPVRLGGLSTADPLDPAVAAWWKAKADEIYGVIPDFGGFLVKANSEGQPGPKDYNRTHADGANMMAAALAPHGGHVIWRAFIYDEDVDPDRAKRAYIEFMKLDGQFHPSVLVQVKNGAIDFMPREPFHPLFGAMEKTPVLAEIQATQEYLGQARHLVYLGPMWEEFLRADTRRKGPGSTVGKALEGAIHPYRVTGMASVTNPGTDRNWCGHHFSQANWYAAGRLAWDHALSASAIAEEWVRMTFTNDAPTVKTIHDMMMGSREAFVNYTMPLGLHHLIGGDHYAPMPQNDRAQRADWTATYYHQASRDGIGFDRTMKGNQAVAQYAPPVRDLFDDPKTCPEMFLLWFHRLPWDYRTRSGAPLWDAICAKYREGARQAAAMQVTWRSLEGRIDPRRHREVADRLAVQVEHAAAWRDQILGYFQQFSQRPLPRASS